MSELINPYQQQPPQQQQYNIPVSTDELYATQIQEEKVKNFIAQISPDNQIIELQWRLKGYIKDVVTQEWIKIEKNVAEPSAEMVTKYVGFASSILNQGTPFGNLGEGEINKLMIMYIQWYVDDMDSYAEEYLIGDNYTERTRIGLVLFNFIYCAIKRSMNGIESKRIFDSLNLGETNTMGLQQQRRGGIMEALKNWRM